MKSICMWSVYASCKADVISYDELLLVATKVMANRIFAAI
jgi:hypothetical protein